jgi:hypothetical protein
MLQIANQRDPYVMALKSLWKRQYLVSQACSECHRTSVVIHATEKNTYDIPYPARPALGDQACRQRLRQRAPVTIDKAVISGNDVNIGCLEWSQHILPAPINPNVILIAQKDDIAACTRNGTRECTVNSQVFFIF